MENRINPQRKSEIDAFFATNKNVDTTVGKNPNDAIDALAKDEEPTEIRISPQRKSEIDAFFSNKRNDTEGSQVPVVDTVGQKLQQQPTYATTAMPQEPTVPMPTAEEPTVPMPTAEEPTVPMPTAEETQAGASEEPATQYRIPTFRTPLSEQPKTDGLMTDIDTRVDAVADELEQRYAEDERNRIKGRPLSERVFDAYETNDSPIAKSIGDMSAARQATGADRIIKEVMTFSDEQKAQLNAAIAEQVASDRDYQDAKSELEDVIKSAGADKPQVSDKDAAEIMKSLTPEQRKAAEAEIERVQAEIARATNVFNIVSQDVAKRVSNKVNNDIVSRIIDRLATRNMPKSDMEYIGKAIYNNSIAGMLYETAVKAASGSSWVDYAVSAKGLERYDASTAAKVAGGVGALLADSGIFSILSMGGGAAAGAITNLATRIVAGRIAQGATTTLAKGALQQTAKRIATSQAITRLASNVIAQSATLGSYDAASSILQQNLANPEGIDWVEVLKRAGTGAASGAAVGGIGVATQAVKGLPRMDALKAKGLPMDIAIGSLGLLAENAAFVGIGSLASGEDADLQSFAEGLATLGILKGVGMLKSGMRNPSNRVRTFAERTLSDLRFTPEEEAAFRKAGIAENGLSIIRSAVEHAGETTTTEESAGTVRDTYNEVMASKEIPLSAKVKLQYIVTGQVQNVPDVVKMELIEPEGDRPSKIKVNSYDSRGRLLSVSEFADIRAARAYINKYNSLVERNSIAQYEQMVNGVSNLVAIDRAARRYAAENNADAQEIFNDILIAKGIVKGDLPSDERLVRAAEVENMARNSGRDFLRDIVRRVAVRNEASSQEVMQAMNVKPYLRTEKEKRLVADYVKEIKGFVGRPVDIRPPKPNTTGRIEEGAQTPAEPAPDVAPQNPQTPPRPSVDDAMRAQIENAVRSASKLRSDEIVSVNIGSSPFGSGTAVVREGYVILDENGDIDPTLSDSTVVVEFENGIRATVSIEDIDEVIYQGDVTDMVNRAIERQEQAMQMLGEIDASLGKGQSVAVRLMDGTEGVVSGIDEYENYIFTTNDEQGNAIAMPLTGVEVAEIRPIATSVEMPQSEQQTEEGVADATQGQGAAPSVEDAEQPQTVEPEYDEDFPPLTDADFAPVIDYDTVKWAELSPKDWTDTMRLYTWQTSENPDAMVVRSARSYYNNSKSKVANLDKRIAAKDKEIERLRAGLDRAANPQETIKQSKRIQKAQEERNALVRSKDAIAKEMAQYEYALREYGIDVNDEESLLREQVALQQERAELVEADADLERTNDELALQEMKTIVNTEQNRKKVYDLYVARGVTPEQAGLRQAILWDIATGNVRLRWEDGQTPSGAKTKGLASELGLGGSASNKRTYKSVVSRDGMSVDEYVHSLWEQRGGYTNDLDDMEMKNEVLDVLKGAPNGSRALEQLYEMLGIAADREEGFGQSKADIERRIKDVDARIAENQRAIMEFNKRVNDVIGGLENKDASTIVTDRDNNTLFKKKETPEPTNSSTDVDSNLNGKSDDTATRQGSNVSIDKDSNNSAESVETSRDQEQSGTLEFPSMNVSLTSESKDSNNSAEKQEKTEEIEQKPAQPSARTENVATSKPAAPSNKIEDYGEVILGARKDAMKELAKSVDNATLESLISLPFAKAFKRPDLRKAVDEGALREQDARFAEAVMASYLSTKKPKADTKKDKYRKAVWGKSKVEVWADEAYKGVQLLKQLFEAEPAERDRIMAEALAEHYTGVEAAKAYQERLKKWNPGKTFTGESYPINNVALFNEVLGRLGNDVGTTDIPVVGEIPNTSYDSYRLIRPNGDILIPTHTLRTFEDVVDEVVYLTKLNNADADTEHPRSAFKTRGLEPQKEVVGYYVNYFSTIKSNTVRREEFKTKEAADDFYAEISKKGAIASGPHEMYSVSGYGKYEIVFKNPITEEWVETGMTYESEGDALFAIDQERDALNKAVNDKLAQANEKTGKTKATEYIQIHSYFDSGKWKYGVAIADKYGPKKTAFDTMPYYFAEGFSTRKEAEAALEKNRAEWEGFVKDIIRKRQEYVYFDGKNAPRVGKDYRGGKDVTEKDFAETFGFRGVQFGNWTNQNDRQAAVNNAYDSFMDLANIIGVSPRALSLNGELGIAFGSRGSGSANAHYEPNNVVINLTKTRGAGSLAHEWWHALDNYFARQAKVPAGFVTSDKKLAMREQLRQAFDDLIDDVAKSDYNKRSRERGTYWGSPIEETARLFAEWVVDEQIKRGERNHFLAEGIGNAEANYAEMNYLYYRAATEMSNKSRKRQGQEPEKVMSFEEFKKTPMALAGFVYPSAEELRTLGEDVRAIFDTVQERIDEETGNVALFHIREDKAPKKTGIGYKVFVLKNGQLYPPMVANPNGEATPVGVWLDADAAPVIAQSKTGRNKVKAGGKGTQGGSGFLAYRPGWHLGEIPYALQFNRLDENGDKTLFPANFVWAEVEYADDVDYQDEAMSYGVNPSGKFQHSLAGLPYLPKNGAYRYRTNPNPETDPWIITGAMRVKRLLTPTEVDNMVRAAGREPQRRQEGAITDEQINALNEAFPKTNNTPPASVDADRWNAIVDMVKESVGTENVITNPEDVKAEYDRIMAGQQRVRERIVEDANSRFNEQLEQQIAGTLPQGHIYQLGTPSPILLSCGLPNLPIELAASRLSDKSMQENYPFDLPEIEGLVDAIQNPLAVFRSATRIGSNVILTELKHGDKSFVVAIQTNRRKDRITVNDIRSIHYRNTDMNIVNWINEGLADYIKPTFAQEWLEPTIKKLRSKPQYNSAEDRAQLKDVAKVVKEFENPKVEAENLRQCIVYHGSGADFEKFDHSHMGEGEGAQAYGWGTYVTEVNGIAKSYAEESGGYSVFYKGLPVSDLWTKYMLKEISMNKYQVIKEVLDVMKQGIGAQEAFDKIKDRYYELSTDTEFIDKLRDYNRRRYNALQRLNPKDFTSESTRNLYTVDIPDDNGQNYLKWEKPLPADFNKDEIKETILQETETETGGELEYEMLERDLTDSLNDAKTGKDLYKAISLYVGDKRASLLLSEMGFVGISYPAQFQSGGRSDGARNYVIFNENDAHIVDHERYFRTPNGEVYGFTIGGRIYLDSSKMNAETPIHEYTELWSKVVAENNPELWRRGKELLTETDTWKEVNADKNYKDLSEDERASETLSRIVAKDAAKKISEISDNKTLVAKLRAWLRQFWKDLKATFSKWSKDDLSKLKVDEFTKIPLRDLVEKVDLSKYTKAKQAQAERGRFMFAGEKGAVEADRVEEATTRMDNLAVARKMEADSKDAHTIKLATGWERGADGKWRYEIPDAKIKDAITYNKSDGTTGSIKRWNLVENRNTTLGESVDAPELFDSYPQLKQVLLDTGYTTGREKSNGYYDARQNLIVIHASDSEHLHSILNHEIQHAIQNIEGFAQGGNPDMLQSQNAERVNELQQMRREIEQEVAEGNTDREDELEEIDLELGYYDPEIGGYDYYRHLSGEVEARNVERRMKMTPEERRASLAAETEDVARDDQVFLYDNLDATRSASISEPAEPNAPVEDNESQERTQVDALSAKIAALQAKARNRTQNVRDLTAEVIRFVKDKANDEVLKNLGEQRFRSMMNGVQAAMMKIASDRITPERQRAEIRRQLDKIDTRITEALVKSNRDAIEKMLNLRVYKFNPMGVLMGNRISENTRRIFDLVQAGITTSSKSWNDRENRYVYYYTLKEGHATTIEDLLQQIDRQMYELPVEDNSVMYKIYAVQILQRYNNAIIIHDAIDEINSNLNTAMANRSAAFRAKQAALEAGDADKHAEKLLEWRRLGEEIVGLQGDLLNRIHLYNDALAEFRQGLVSLIENGRSAWLDAVQQEAEERLALMRTAFSSIRVPGAIPYKEKEIGKDVAETKENRNNELRTLVSNALPAVATFDSMLRAICINDIGNRYGLYDKIMGGEDGLVFASDKQYKNKQMMFSMVEDKIKELGLGKDINALIARSKKPTDMHIINKDVPIREKHTGEIMRYRDGNIIFKMIELNVGELMYLYSSSRQEQGRNMLLNAGINELQIDTIEDYIADKFPKEKQFVDWVTDELLPTQRDERYNGLYEYLYKTQMPDTPHYFPLEVNKKQLYKAEEIGEEVTTLPTSTVGSIIARREHNYGLNLDTNFVDKLIGHINDMEHWYAFAKPIKQINTLLSSTQFRNVVEAQAKGAVSLLKQVANIAVGGNEPNQAGKLPKLLRAISRNDIAANITFRFNTALKQTLSYPAYFAYSASPRYWMYMAKAFNPKNIKANWVWAMNELPTVRERWERRSAGFDQFNINDIEVEYNRTLRKAVSAGMWANSAVDLLTCTVGARAIYEFEYSNNLKSGMSPKEADTDAKYRAALFLNQTQQSGDGIFLSRMQKTPVYSQLMAYRNANTGYARLEIHAVAEATRMLSGKTRKRLIDARKEYYKGQGMSDTAAEHKAKHDYWQNFLRVLMVIGVFGGVLPWVWQKSSKGILGHQPNKDDDDKDNGVFFIPGLSDMPIYGPAVDDIYRNSSQARFGLRNMKFISAPTLETIKNNGILIWDQVINGKEAESEDKEAWFVTLSLATRFGLGFDAKTFENMFHGVKGIMRDKSLDYEDAMEMLNAPRSAVKAVVGPIREGETKDEYMQRLSFANRRIRSNDVLDKKIEKLYFENLNNKLYKEMGISPSEVKTLSERVKEVKKRLHLTGTGYVQEDYWDKYENMPAAQSALVDSLGNRIYDIYYYDYDLNHAIEPDNTYKSNLKGKYEALKQLNEEYDKYIEQYGN